MGLSQLNSAPPSSHSSSFYMRAFILLWWCGLLVTSVAGGNNETDWLALLEFKAKITDDPLQVMSSWNDSFHFCQWQGVTCGRRHRRVTALNLQSLKLVGSISPHVGNLSFLRNLTIQNNSFHNEIPPEIGRLHRMQFLQLQNNTLSGKIPSNLSSCTNLELLYASHNLLIGEIPATLGTLSKLRNFLIFNNDLTGSMPPSLGNLSFLEFLYISENHLGGIIPDSFGQLSKIKLFGVYSNKLSGTIPPSIFNLSSLIKFHVGLNQIQGHLPSDIGITLPNIEILSIAYNQFTGSIPLSISNASNLITLGLNHNKLSGKVPSLEKLNRISFFAITNNILGNGEKNDLSFLCSLTNSTYLAKLGINGNKFGGELPRCIGNLSTSLDTFVLDTNRISGKIPTDIGNLINLERLDMYQNKLSGDFGLARFLSSAIQDSSQNQSSSIGIRGTIGYTPPEYGVGNEVSTYGDVYSYGILLLEMFTGKRPIDNIFQESLNLRNFVKAALPVRISDIIDPILLCDREEGETSRVNDITRNKSQNGGPKIQECLIFILGIGVACSAEFPSERKNMSAVIIELHAIRKKLLGTNLRRQRLEAKGAQG